MPSELLAQASGAINEALDERGMCVLDLVKAAGVEARQVGYAVSASPLLAIDDLISIAAALDLAVAWEPTGGGADAGAAGKVSRSLVTDTRRALAETVASWRTLSGFATTKMANLAGRKIGAFQIVDGSKPGNVGAEIAASYLALVGFDLVVVSRERAMAARAAEVKLRRDQRAQEAFLRKMAFYLREAPTWHQLSEDDPDVARACVRLRAAYESGAMPLKQFARESGYDWKTLARSDGTISFAGQIDRACITASFVGMGLALVDRGDRLEETVPARTIVIDDERRAAGAENVEWIVAAAEEIALKRDMTPVTSRSSLEALSITARAAGLRLIAVDLNDLPQRRQFTMEAVRKLKALERPSPVTDVDRSKSEEWLKSLPTHTRIENVALHPRATEVLFSQVANVCAREGLTVTAVDRRSGKDIATIGTWTIEEHRAFIGRLFDLRRACGLTVEEAIARCRQADPEKNLTGPLTPFSYVYTYADAIGCDLTMVVS